MNDSSYTVDGWWFERHEKDQFPKGYRLGVVRPMLTPMGFGCMVHMEEAEGFVYCYFLGAHSQSPANKDISWKELLRRVRATRKFLKQTYTRNPQNYPKV